MLRDAADPSSKPSDPESTGSRAQNVQIRANHVLIGIEPLSAPNGGSGWRLHQPLPSRSYAL